MKKYRNTETILFVINFFIIICLFISNVAIADTKYYVTDLGTLGGVHPSGYTSEPQNINNFGQIVGHSYINSEDVHAFLWVDGLMQDIGTLGGERSWARDINNLGEIVGYSNTDSSNTFSHAFLYGDGGMQDIGTLGGRSYALSINDSSQVVGHSEMSLGDIIPSHAFLWTENQGMQDLGTLGGDISSAYSINDFGQAVGMSTIAPGLNPDERRAFLWTEEGMVAIEGLGGNWDYANDINNLGQVVGSSRTTSGDVHAFLYDTVNGIQDLGTLGGDISSAYCINDFGQVVGLSRTIIGDSDSNHAFLWTSEKGMLDLNDFLYNDADMMLEIAYGVNDSGEIVCRGEIDLDNNGTYDEIHAFLLTPINTEQIRIDIKPGEGDNCVNINDHGVIPIAILGSADFDVTQVNPSTCECAGMTVKMVGKSNKYLASYEDVNQDGFDDLVVKIEDSDAELDSGVGTATLTCELYDGTQIEGSGTICIVP